MLLHWGKALLKAIGILPASKSLKTVQIGNQIWMAENLNIKVKGSYCYGNDPANCKRYGRLYTWKAANKAVNLVPGWHLPTDEEWKTLERNLGMGAADAKTRGWRDSGDVGTKLEEGGSSGFDARFAGCGYSYGYFSNLGLDGCFWSASPLGSSQAWHRQVYRGNSGVYRHGNHRNYRFSVRVLKD